LGGWLANRGLSGEAYFDKEKDPLVRRGYKKGDIALTMYALGCGGNPGSVPKFPQWEWAVGNQALGKPLVTGAIPEGFEMAKTLKSTGMGQIFFAVQTVDDGKRQLLRMFLSEKPSGCDETLACADEVSEETQKLWAAARVGQPPRSSSQGAVSPPEAWVELRRTLNQGSLLEVQKVGVCRKLVPGGPSGCVWVVRVWGTTRTWKSPTVLAPLSDDSEKWTIDIDNFLHVSDW
jgi:hypothetical protein